ncbi:alpha/beta hydrolase [Rhodovulum tesquicola]|uniref:alpha/beta hydrolase n=1 Tax=Rhodovulum tesquicola TaxID=540254 RepID=UPI002098456F|nr:alpha/beta fold hydrolase [Rhodovulum tesquicola]MCO8146013.1 alpha/beta hydrolase [Rhodovulum tesquicola]
MLRALSPGEPARLLGEAGQRIAGSLSERVFAPINGIRQGMIIQSRDTSNPVLLFLHGGPGVPEFFLNTTHPTGLENDFTVVWWEQRGAGLSFSADIPPQSMTVAQMIADTVAVADYLRVRFQQDKIYLLGHSWGSFLGIQVAAAAPERFHAYIGMGQVSHQLQSEVAAHAFLLEQYRALGDTVMVRRLEAAPVSVTDGLSNAWLRARDDAMHGLGVGTTRDTRSVISGVFIPVWRCRAYTIREKIAIWRGLAWSRRFLWDEFIATDLTTRIHRLDLPVYFFAGAHDLTANHDLSRMYFDQSDAPVKGFYTFDASAHSPLFEEPLRAREILRQDVLFNRVRLADGPAGD